MKRDFKVVGALGRGTSGSSTASSGTCRSIRSAVATIYRKLNIHGKAELKKLV